MKMKLEFLVLVFMQLLSPTEALTWTVQPTSATGIQGKSVSITWAADLDNGETWTTVRISQEVAGVVNKQPMIRYSKTSGILVYAAYISRSADLNLTASLNGTILTTVFTMKNLNRSTDEHLYLLRINFNDNLGDPDSRDSADLSLKVLVPPTITSPASSLTSVTVNETQTAQLVCTATGHPTPSINWTRDGAIVGTGSPFTTPAVTFNDDKACYTCVAYNEAQDKTADFCLSVQYKPRNATMGSDRSTVCQNDKVNLKCTSGPANPAPSSYEFYNNGVLIGTSASNVYEATATAGLPDVNKFVCVPRNILGDALENGSVVVTAKVPPVIVTSPQATTTLVEGNALSLFCNASGLPAPNITWTKVGGSNVGSTETFTISSITRGQEGTYRCTASNGDECSNVTADANVVVNYPPESTSIATNKSDITFLKGNSVKLSCASTSKPKLCNVAFYHGNTVIQSYSGKTCAGPGAATHVIQNIDGCNLEEYSCKAENQYGQQEAKINLTINVPATIATSPAADVLLVEGDALQLNCTATGCPTANVTWTKTGNPASLASGNGFFLSHGINSLGKSDTGNYKCCVDNGVVGSPVEKTIYVNVTYKPYQTALTSTLSKACLNDAVTLRCTTTANPPAHEYRFYLNDQLVHTSMSGVYQLNVPQAGNNTYKCEPKNSVGGGQNATVTIATKVVSPMIVSTTPSQEVRAGSSHTLYCNVQTHGESINVTWHKVGSGRVSSTGVYTIPSVTRADSGSYQCKAQTGNGCEVTSTIVQITVISAPNISNIIVSEDSLTVTWSNLLLPHNKIATCLIHVMESFNGISWTAASNTSRDSSISCSVSGLQPSTLYRIKYFLQVNENHVNGTIYIGTSAKGVSSNHSPFPSTGVPTNVFAAVTAVAVVVIVVLILVVIRMRFQGIQNDKRVSSKEKKKSSLSNPSSLETAYENKDFTSRETKPVEDITLYEQVQNRDRVMNQDGSSFPMHNLSGRPGRLEGIGGSITAENQFPSQYEEPSYQSLDQSQMEATKRDNGNQGSYGHLVDFARRPDNKTLISPQDQDHYQELQPVNHSKYYQSLQNMQRSAFNV